LPLRGKAQLPLTSEDKGGKTRTAALLCQTVEGAEPKTSMRQLIGTTGGPGNIFVTSRSPPHRRVAEYRLRTMFAM
jgi:hypothetical protein